MVKGNKKIKKPKEAETPNLQAELELQLEEESRSTSVDTESIKSFLSFGEAETEEEISILDTLYQTDSESQEDDVPEYVLRCSLLPEQDFLQDFGQLPDIDNISVESIARETSITENEADADKCVSPLTELKTERSIEKFDAKYEDHQEELSSNQDMSIKRDLLLPTDDLVEIEDKKPVALDDTFGEFLELQKKPEITVAKEIDWEALAREEEVKQFKKHTLTFLNDLINNVVHISQNQSRSKILQHNLDKRKLLIELNDKLSNLYGEKRQCVFLNRQAVQYFRRKKIIRTITEDNPKTLRKEKLNLEKSKRHLDEVLGKEQKLIQVSTELQTKLTEQYNNLKQQAESYIEKFEEKVKSCLCRNGHPTLNSEIVRLLLVMKKYRQEVSELRLSLFLHQHTEAKLSHLIKEMSDLGNGLNVNNFTNLQAETQTLDKKIEERNADLNKLHKRCHDDIHILAHYKENQQLLSDAIDIQTITFDNLMNKKRHLRERLFSLKLQRNSINKKIKKLSIQAGLLDKPELMFDYDNTARTVGEKKETIKHLRRTLIRAQRKLDKFLLRCPNIQI